MSNFLKALGQGLRIAGASQSPENFAIYNRQNEFQALQEEKRRELVLGLLIKGVENGAPGAKEALEKFREQNPEYAGVPDIGKSIELRKLEEEQRRFDAGLEESKRRREAGDNIIAGLGLGLNKAKEPEVSDIPPIVQSPESFVPDPQEQNPDFEGRSYKPAPHLTGDEQQLQKYIADSTPIPEGATPRERELVENYRAGSPYVPSPVGASAKPEDAAIPQTKESASDNYERVSNYIKSLYEAATKLDSLEDPRADGLREMAKFLESDEKTRHEIAKNQVTIDDNGIYTNHVDDYQFVEEKDEYGNWTRRRIGSDESMERANKGRAAGATKVSQKVTTSTATKYGERFGTLGAETDFEDWGKAKKSAIQATKSEKLIDLLKSGKPITGFMADMLYELERAKNFLIENNESIEKISDSELVNALMGEHVFSMIGELGIGARGIDTPAEREFLRDVIAGRAPMNEKTLLKLAEYRLSKAKKEMRDWNNRVQMIPKEVLEGTGHTRESLTVRPPAKEVIDLGDGFSVEIFED